MAYGCKHYRRRCKQSSVVQQDLSMSPLSQRTNRQAVTSSLATTFNKSFLQFVTLEQPAAKVCKNVAYVCKNTTVTFTNFTMMTSRNNSFIITNVGSGPDMRFSDLSRTLKVGSFKCRLNSLKKNSME